MTVGVVTIVRGRHRHLQAQLDGLARGSRRPDHQVIVAMDDPAVDSLTGATTWPVRVVHLVVDDPSALPLAEARNVGAAAALADGADRLVFLDVDCIPSSELIRRYHQVTADPAHREALCCGPVAYLPAPGPQGYPADDLVRLAEPHPARPVPAPDEVIDAPDRRLFWSLSFAVTAPTWSRIGGFWPGYTGYGGEDTDFAESAHCAGVPMKWVGGALAFHQHHPVSSPPVEHVEAIVGNAQLFHRRWGWWPMTGWLDQFAALGLAGFDDQRGWHLRALGGPS